MNGGRVAKRLLAVVLALSTLVTLGLYYNGLSGNYRQESRPRAQSQSPRALGDGLAGPADDSARSGDGGSSGSDDDDDVDPSSNDLADGPPFKSDVRRPNAPRVELSAAVDQDTCPELPLADTSIETVKEFSKFEFQVRTMILHVYTGGGSRHRA